MNVPAKWRERAASNRMRIVLADAEDPRASAAAEVINESGLADAVVIDANSRHLVSTRMERTAAGLRRSVDFDDPLDVATLMVAAGEADGCVAGASRPTADVIRAGLRILGLSTGTTTVSSCFVFMLPDHGPGADDPRRMLVYGDCGVIPDPDSEQLADIALAAAGTFAALSGRDPQVAMLSFSTKGSAAHPHVDKVRAAVDRVRALDPDLAIDGELQFDAAWDAAIGQTKAPNSSVAGAANVFIFPDLNSGNIAYKITERLVGARAFGPLLQGLDGVLHDLSRGCSISDIVNVATIAAIQAAERSTAERSPSHT